MAAALGTSVTLADWRAQVEKELGGKSFESALVAETIEGLSVQPLYIEAPADPLARQVKASPFRICMRASASEMAADVEGGADAVWTLLDDVAARQDLKKTFFVFDLADPKAAISILPASACDAAFALNHDPLAQASPDLAALGPVAKAVGQHFPKATSVTVSTLRYHAAGADAADEIAIALSTGVLYLEALRAAHLSIDDAAPQVALQVSVADDTFLELSKVRALRACWQKLLTAAGVVATALPRTTIHAVCSSRTLAVRDPWVNMLRVTTQVVSAVLGGADLVTPATFDQAYGTSSTAHARRVARNTGLVLREESFLGKVSDPAGGSYYLDSLTDALAREAWKRFRTIEQGGGIEKALTDGSLFAKIEATWKARVDRVSRRKNPVVGVSEFANLIEALPHAAPKSEGQADAAHAKSGLPEHRDAAAFEDLRLKADALPSRPEALLVTLGPLAETRPRVGFATGFFAAGGIASKETTEATASPLACLCGTDERYAAEAEGKARALKAAGCKRVLLAGRPGPLEASLREAGVDGFLFVGCDAVSTLSDLLDNLS